MTIQNSSTLLIGNFDGVHLGHQSLINFAKKIASSSNTELSLVTFCPHPREIILKKSIDLIIPYSEKIEILKTSFIDNVVEIKFTDEISKMNPDDFIQTYLFRYFEYERKLAAVKKSSAVLELGLLKLLTKSFSLVIKTLLSTGPHTK